MKIEVLVWRGSEIVKESLGEDSLQAIADAYPYDGDIGMFINGEYCVVEFAEDKEPKITLCTKEQAELNALA